MARWKLTSAHYLNVPGTEWEYKEVSRETGRQARKVFEVPLYLDPKDPGDCNYPPDEIIVTNGGTCQPRDIKFVGKPTPEMEPLDDEAIAQTEAERPRWKNPIEQFGEYSQSLISSFEAQIAALMANQVAAPAGPVAKGSISPTDFAKLQEQVAALMEQNAAMAAELAERRA